MGTCEGKVAVVTGSSSGIGEAVARRFAAEGAAVVVNSATSVDAGRRVAESLPDATYVQADVSTPAGAAAVVQAAVGKWGRLDHLVNNAGWTKVVPHADIDAADLELWRRVFEINVFGTWLVCQAALPHLRADGGGSITNVTSLAGVREVGSSIPYACSKAALNHQTELLAKVVGPEVRVNAVAPGLIATPWTADWDAQHAGVESTAPLKRVGTPDDVAEVTLAMATSGYVTGQILVVDGGLGLVV
ncbi:MAG TPA: glucose 1-dehydrogenase [Acidimicrobiales bacterium]|nr:glucose 1-dehydrogenase [Acidimicrobiales bacterium]